MPEKTNLNVAPYYDDFEPTDNYKRVLFKPGVPVQARELTSLQSILQDQIESFADGVYKNGDVVIPGNVAFLGSYDAVLINPNFLGFEVDDYCQELINRKITGKRSGVTAKVTNYISAQNSDLGIDTLYVKYLTPSTINLTDKEFLEDEELILSSGSPIQFGGNIIRLNSSFAKTIAVDAIRSGSAATIDEGVYYIRGFFVTVPKQTIILDQYSNTPSYRVGLQIDEEIITAYDDPDLFDNARGFSNFAAPGADRLQIYTTFTRKPINDFLDENFVELMRVVNGKTVTLANKKKEDLNELRKELARRTYDESGDYVIKPFKVKVRDSLDDYIDNDGLYDATELTSQGNTPSKDLMTLQISPGKAYVRGYEIEKTTETFIDVPKPRVVKKVDLRNAVFSMGNKINVNNVYGCPPLGLNSNLNVSLRDRRSATPGSSVGTEIGQAVLYDFKIDVDQGPHTDERTRYNMFFIDLDMYTKLEINANANLTVPCFIEGASSGASGFLTQNVSNGKTLILSDVTGKFIRGEILYANERSAKIADIKTVTDYSIADIKSVQVTDGASVVFTADTVLDSRSSIDPAGVSYTISAAVAGISTLTNPRLRFSEDKVKVGDIVSYTRTGVNLPIYNRIESISDNGATATISAVSSVDGVCNGALPVAQATTNDLVVVRPRLLDKDKEDLLVPLAHSFVSSIDLSQADLITRKRYSVNVSGGTATYTITDPGLIFEPYDAPEDYMLFDADNGNIETITSGKVSISSDSKTITISGISNVSGSAFLLATVRKVTVVNQTKVLRKCETLTIDKTANATSYNGLTPAQAFGTRVEDDTICLNHADVLRVHAVYQSNDNNDPTLPSITLVNISAAISSLTPGEVIIGNTTKAVALVVSVSGNNKVNVVFSNTKTFSVGETVTFNTSKIVANVSKFDGGDTNIRNLYFFDNGYRPDYLDYSRLVMKKVKASDHPRRRITIVYDRYEIDSNQNGDFVSVGSFSPDDYESNLPSIGVRKASDFLDFRPIVAPYTNTAVSPFQFEGRSFSTAPYVPTTLVTDKPITIAYEHYLGRVDKLSLDQKGVFTLRRGDPSEIQLEPPSDPSKMDIATIFLPPYLSDPDDARITFPSYRRYTMEDIGRLEDRIKNLEYYTQLSLLEMSTSSLAIKDETTGLDRFKSGFFVDNFKSHAAHDLRGFKGSIDLEEGLFRPSHYTTGIELFLGSDIIKDPNEDQKNREGLISPGIRKTGDLLTLDYEEVAGLESKFATRAIEINPFDVENWIGIIDLNPSSDVWVEEKRVSATDQDIKADYSVLIDIFQDDPDPGFVPIDWKSWMIYHTGIPNELKTKSTKEVNDITLGSQAGRIENPIQSSDLDIYKANSIDTRDGVQYKIAPGKYDVKVGNDIINENVTKFMRSRNIEFEASRLKPFTRFYAFFGGRNITGFCVPKLVEIEMVSGVFKIGETITGRAKDDEGDNIRDNDAYFRGRLAHPKHKQGPYYEPTLRFSKNPYDQTKDLPNTYSSTTTILNIDTGSLGDGSETRFTGWIEKGMTLTGEDSEAVCKVKNVRLVSDVLGNLFGSFFIPKHSNKKSGNPRFTTGTKTFRLSTSATNADTDNKAVTSVAEANFTATGKIDVTQDAILSVRDVKFAKTSVSDDKIVSSVDEVDSVTKENVEPNLTKQPEPLAQTFKVAEENGIFLTKVELFFKSKPIAATTAAQKRQDDDENDDALTPITLQIRTVQNGVPTKVVVPFSEVSKTPSQITVSNDADEPTEFIFPSPVYLQGNGTQYALVLITSDDSYEVWVAKNGEEDITSD